MDTRKPAPAALDGCLADHIIGLRHVGHVVADLEATIDEFRRLYGLGEDAVTRVPDPGPTVLARFAFVRVGATEFELVEPVADDQRALLFGVPSGGGGINHVAWEVRDLDVALARLANAGIRPGHVTPDGPVQTPASRIVYLDPATTGGLLVELVEPVDA